jgi:hypothetical protein
MSEGRKTDDRIGTKVERKKLVLLLSRKGLMVKWQQLCEECLTRLFHQHLNEKTCIQYNIVLLLTISQKLLL